MDALPKKESFLGLLEFGESMEQDRFVEDQLLGNGTFINKSYISFSAAIFYLIAIILIELELIFLY